MILKSQKGLKFRGIAEKKRKSTWLDTEIKAWVLSNVVFGWREFAGKLRNMRRGNKLSRIVRIAAETRFARTMVVTMFLVTGTLLALSQNGVGGIYLAEATAQGQEAWNIEENMKTERGVGKPLPYYRINQKYRFYHKGIDLDGELGDEVKPISEGVVESVVYSGFAYGNHIVVNHGSGFRTLYAHLSQVYVKKGQKVGMQHLIGRVGSTGWSTGPHLHLEFWVNGESVDPQPYLE